MAIQALSRDTGWPCFSSGGHSDMPQVGWVKQHTHESRLDLMSKATDFSQLWRLEAHNWNHRLVQVKSLLLAYRWLLPHLVERRRSLVSLPIWALTPSWGSHALMTSFNPNHLTKAPPPNTIALRVMASTCKFGRGGAKTFSPQHSMRVGSIS